MNITKNSGNAQMSPNRHVAYLLSVVLMVAAALPSAASGSYRKQLKCWMMPYGTKPSIMKQRKKKYAVC